MLHPGAAALKALTLGLLWRDELIEGGRSGVCSVPA